MRKGFTLIELILYVAILTLMLTALIPFSGTIIASGAKSATQQELSSNARYISERIKYEIRNSFAINSISATQIVLCKNQSSCATNPTTISYTSPNLTIQNQGAPAVKMHSDDVSIPSLTFTDYSSGSLTEHIQYVFTMQDNFTSARQEYTGTVTIEGSAEVRSN